MNVSAHRLHRLMVPCLMLSLLLLAGGCEIFGMAALMATGGDKVKAVYKLPNGRTAIIVDDPQKRLGSGVLTGVVASNIAHHLKQNDAISATIVPEKDVATLAARLGDEYATTPIDQLGRSLGAQQVIYVEVEQVTLLAAPGAYRPSALVELKVIDAENGVRLYPPPPPIDEPGVPSRGRSVTVQMAHRGIDRESRGADAMMGRVLAERIGLEVARMFYDYRPDPKFD